MTTPLKDFTPERCVQLREKGLLRLMVNLLHEHTLEPDNQSEADFSIEPFLMDFNRKAERRTQISLQLHTILEKTGNNEDELATLEMLTLLRIYIQELYSILGDWETITDDTNTINERADRLTELAVLVAEVFVTFGPDTGKDSIRPIINQLGGAFVMVDYLRAQTRFNTKCHQFESDLIDSTPLLRVANDSKPVLQAAMVVLYSMGAIFDSNDDIRLLLRNSRSLHEIMVGIAEDAYDDGDAFEFVKVYCRLLRCLYYTEDLLDPTGVRPSFSHLTSCGVIKCLAKFGMNIKDPQTLYHVLNALVAPLISDHQNALEFLSIDGAVDMLIDNLVPSKEKDEDVENAVRYEKQRCVLVTVLYFVFGHLDEVYPQDQRLLTIFESRDLAAILVRYLEQVTSDGAMCVLALLRNTLDASDDQHRKFAEMVRAKRVVKRFESCDNEHSARAAKQIGKMFE